MAGEEKLCPSGLSPLVLILQMSGRCPSRRSGAASRARLEDPSWGSWAGKAPRCRSPHPQLCFPAAVTARSTRCRLLQSVLFLP